MLALRAGTPAKRAAPTCMSSQLLQVLVICAGASTGALARWQLGIWLNQGTWPWGTLAANLAGGLLVGVVVAVLQQHPAISPYWRLLLITGFLGALTTFSSFSAEVVAMMMAARWTPALLTIVMNLTGSLLLTYAGWRAAQWMLR